MTTGSDDGLTFEREVVREGDAIPFEGVHQLKPVDMHPFLLEVGLEFYLGAGVIKGLSRDDEVDVGFVDPIEKVGVVESAVDDKEFEINHERQYHKTI